MSDLNEVLAIKIENMSFAFSSASEPTLKNINLEVKKGELIGLVGPTGSGKTTLLNIIAGVSPHYYPGNLQGKVSIFGKSSLEMSMAQISIEVGLVMQDPDSQLFNLFVRDEVIWGLENLGVPREKIAESRTAATKKFRINHLLDRITYDLSGGEKQLTAITSTFVMNPKILLFDNPTSALDPLGTQMVFESIQQLHRDDPDVTIILNDDKVQDLAVYTERMWLIDGGEIKIDAKPEDFFTNGKILANARINMPMVTQVAYELSQRGLWKGKLPLSVEQFKHNFSAT
ncbi:MAG TPA: ABC transporter ATP-binding protein [Anaerolineales bacterium]|nr:ABC transporter ATP-binding protein [Anaerolineales bacterium]